MEWVVATKMQAVEMAKVILQGRDEELAFRLQVEETVRVSVMEASEIRVNLEQCQSDSGSHANWDVNFDAALEVACQELETFVEQLEETLLSVIEINRLAHLEEGTQFVLVTDEVVDDQFETYVIQTMEFWCPKTSGLSCHDERKSRRRVQSSEPGTSRNRGLKLRVYHSGMEQDGKRKRILEDSSDEELLESFFRMAQLEDDRGANQADDEDTQNLCQICFDATPEQRPFITLNGCGHQYCQQCVSSHAMTLIANGKIHITCLQVKCPSTLSRRQLTSLLDKKTLDILISRRRESYIPASEIIYCPFKDCLKMATKPSTHGQQPQTSSDQHPSDFSKVKCGACHRAFCFQCNIAWHEAMSCGEYNASQKNQRLLGDEKLLMMAAESKWQRCSKCGTVIERSGGCSHMQCRCGHNFCYGCGVSWQGAGVNCMCP
ncbi:uncharacterized protein [Physcomitrium patens]|uniref:RBR-type E3 ubiquitin transferase n=1 Tax=Physcomitrium patens TaxID=3218 RepID=A0A2K1KUC7_PHYPA|nr:E3 ubiquitin-protein ligase dbl4-like [Physcomitrium patens]PNR57383.1 hypothetical protein PHYPA_004377 [Physcomitrium patens]|eukprot:XP_024371780.1 E3 ubiquitin-protein ligase dbl4-like [Physcomitrella patens]